PAPEAGRARRRRSNARSRDSNPPQPPHVRRQTSYDAAFVRQIGSPCAQERADGRRMVSRLPSGTAALIRRTALRYAGRGGGTVLASTSRLGDAYLYVIAPVAIFSALVIWIAMTLMTSRHRWSRRTPSGPRGMPNRGPVQGGIIRGSPSQRNRR